MKSKVAILFVLMSLIFGSVNLILNENCKASGNEIYVDVSYHGYRDGSPEKPYNFHIKHSLFLRHPASLS